MTVDVPIICCKNDLALWKAHRWVFGSLLWAGSFARIRPARA